MVTSSGDIEITLKELKPFLADEYFISHIGYFGSYSSGDQTEESDIDILVEFSKPIGRKFFTLESYLEKVLGKKIDLVTIGALKHQLKDIILDQVKFV